MKSLATGSHRLAINADWFGRLRWVAAAGQLATIAFVSGVLRVATPIVPLLVLVGVTLLSNLLFWWWSNSRRVPPSQVEWHTVLGGLMLLDLVVLTAMLGLTGGPTNPFVVFYFVNLALSGVVLPAVWAWVLSALAILAFATISYVHLTVPVLSDPARLESLSTSNSGVPLAIIGGWIAFSACAMVIVNFTTRLTSEIRQSEQARRQAEQQRARFEKLEALGTLAAGAAHELATPLSTIAVAVSEAQRELDQAGVEVNAIEDLALVRREVDRCRAILDRMAIDSGQPAAGAPERLTADELLGDVIDEIPARSRVELRWVEDASELWLNLPSVAVAQALRAIVQNGIDATDEVDPAGMVTITGDRLAKTLRLTIADPGPGMPAEVLARASEPFYTTKEPGRGMGLGLFLARSVIERVGGSLRLESPAGSGTLAIVVLPLA